VGVRINRLGNKSFDFLYTIEDSQTGNEHAHGSTVQVAFDYHTAQTIPIPEDWRKIITEFENL
jgi:acyl-CoA thioester hydrolase